MSIAGVIARRGDCASLLHEYIGAASTREQALASPLRLWCAKPAASHVKWECGVGSPRMGRIFPSAYDRSGRPSDTPASGRSNGETAMDAVVKPWRKSSPADPGLSDHGRAARPSREQALAAVRTLIAYAGDYPDREG